MTKRIPQLCSTLALSAISGLLFAGCGSTDAAPAAAGSGGQGAFTGTGGSATGGQGAGANTGGAPAAGGNAGASTGLGGSPTTGGVTGVGGGAGAGGVGPNGWKLVWSDEFDGSAIDPKKWEHEVNCWGGGNGEQQCYVADAKNSFVAGGALHLVALKDAPSGVIGGPGNDNTPVTRPYSSARLRTKHLADWKYGRMEAYAKLPWGQGLWPAFWMLPTDEIYGGWAASGEIDIMETVNLMPGANHVVGTLHYGASWPGNVHTGTSYDPPTNTWESFHLYAVEWEEGEMRWFVDGHQYARQNKWNTKSVAFPAPFDQLFHLLLNVAVGGAWPGPPNAQTNFPQEMGVDYVRVYQCAADPVKGHGCGTSDPGVAPL